jgi:hypothetical protein
MDLLTVILLLPAAVLVFAAGALLILFLLGNTMQVDVRFESSDGQWADVERTFKGYRYPDLARAFERYAASLDATVSLVRTTPMDWRKIALWPTYLLNRKWRVPCEPRRVAARQLLPATRTAEVLDHSAVSRYLDECARHRVPATLVGIVSYVDHHHRIIPTAEEVNMALERHAVGGLHPVTAAEVDAAYAVHRERVRARSGKQDAA